MPEAPRRNAQSPVESILTRLYLINHLFGSFVSDISCIVSLSLALRSGGRYGSTTVQREVRKSRRESQNMGNSARSCSIIGRKKINIETRRSTTLKQRVILVQGPC